MIGALLVALGAAVGAPARYLVDRAVQRRLGPPWGTALVNIAGSFVLGVLAGLPGGLAGAGPARLLVGTGFCGALTTWSTFAYETVQRAGEGRSARAAAEALTGIATGVLAAALGALAAQLAR